MSDQTDFVVDDAQDQGFEQAETATETPAWADTLMSHVTDLSSKVDSFVPQEQTPSFQQLADPSYDPYADQGYEPEQYEQQPQVDQMGNQQQAMSQQQAEQYLQGLIDRGVESRLTPYMAQQRALQIEQQYPELQKPEVVGQLQQDAVRLAQSMGNPDLARNPDFLLLAYQAKQAASSASQQTAADEQPGSGLEGGGAQAPGEETPNLAERMLAAGPTGPAAQFWGA